MIYFNKASVQDKIKACWIGKNLGGTIGAPYEGTTGIHDIKGFMTKEGEVIPNDDLDLQLIWLKAMEEQGPKAVDEKVLGEYWLQYVMPNWNEYGVGKSNMREGFLPPLSGELYNTRWKHSNGAWIRTEVWACLYPGLPEKAIEYAYADACVDHGFGEGTYAAIFVAALEAAAFVFHDVDELLNIGLSKIPSDCRVARSVNIVRDAYKRGVDWKSCRQMLVEDSADLGWFQAPANVAFVVLGLLYGEGDFKKSMLTAINCGDDTDCTGGTIGAIMGIMGGTAGLPQDWVQYMGDAIVQACLLYGHGRYPTSNTQLTECIMNMHPITLHIPFYPTDDTPKTPVVIYDGENDFGDLKASDYYGTDFVDRIIHSRSPYSFTGEAPFFKSLLEFEKAPKLLPGESLKGKVSVALKGRIYQRHFHLRWFVPEGWQVTGSRHIYVPFVGHDRDNTTFAEFEITAGEQPAALSRIGLEISTDGIPGCIYMPIQIMG